MRFLRCLPRFREAYRQLPVLAQREQWSRAQIDSYQLEQLNLLWKTATRSVPYYRSLRAERDLPEQFMSLVEYQQTVPLLPKAVVRQSPQRFLSETAQAGCWERTSGSTGIPMSLYHDWAGHQTMQHAKYRLYDAWGIDILDRSAYVWSRADLVQTGWRSALSRAHLGILDLLRDRQRFSAFRLDSKSLDRCLQGLEKFQPSVLYGFSNAIFLLAQQAGERGFAAKGLKAVVMTSEPAMPRMQAAVAKAFHAPVVVEYGATECELIAGTYPDGTIRVREDLVIVEALPNASGGHELVISVLTNDSFPLLRYQIGDLIDGPLEYPNQGFAILRGAIAGRRDDLLQTRSGGFLHASAIDALFEHEFDSPAIRRYRAHQCATGAVTLQIEIDATRELEFDPIRLERAMGEMVEGYSVEVELIAELPKLSSAKHRTITSDLAAVLHS